MGDQSNGGADPRAAVFVATSAAGRGNCRDAKRGDPQEPGADFTRQRLAAMAGFFEAVTELHDQMKGLPTGTVRKLLRMGTKVRRKK